MRVIIFANGEFNEFSKNHVKPGDYIIAADGGAIHCIGMKIIPDVVIGDFDSLSYETLQTLKKPGTRILSFPAKKDQTDMELAMDYALSQGAEEIIILGALGARWDMTFANVLLMAKDDYSGASIRIIDQYTEIFLIKPGGETELSGSEGDMVSLIPLAGNVLGVTTKGLEYSLDNEILFFGSPRGVSNLMAQKKAVIHINHGILLCILIHKPD
ncbi:thiamine pyrophosphokinase [Desulfonema limicola]|uniref:Thiamine diphosphokinase n=1 Tax=Desulfonema limicola TaxID=45656 RepID=A0A975GIA4_9BACT|nr:thiamine diphosphokinase [Desulfonema limicola]QTA82332.1 thiamine pyrophosphokinase [Desulfonema limicola]